ncbi:MAG: YciI family protein [Acidimicrobiales bacterium]
MRYLMLICGPEFEASSEDEAAMMKEYDAFGNEMGQRGVLRGGERLHASSDATTVQVRDGKVLTSDGPFAETKEQIGGYFVVECDDLDAAIDVASKIPGARFGSIEVRPIWEM